MTMLLKEKIPVIKGGGGLNVDAGVGNKYQVINNKLRESVPIS